MFRKTLVLVALLAPLALTQSAGTHRHTVPGGVRSMRGCLQKNDDGSFYLLSQRGTRVALEGGEDLSVHIGQLVKASGAFVDTKAGSSDDKAADKLHPEHEFRVIKIDVVSQTCSAGKKK